MHRDNALAAFAAFLGMDAYKTTNAAALVRYANENQWGGYPEKWPSGSLWAVEGEILYALVRALCPDRILELGVHKGASTTHLRAAVRENEHGFVTSVDRLEGTGDLIPAELAPYGTIAYDWAVEYIKQLPDASIDFALEDLCHGAGEVYDVVTALRPKLKPGAVVVHHDSEHGDDGVRVRQGLNLAGVDYLSVLAEPSDCGLGLWSNR